MGWLYLPATLLSAGFLTAVNISYDNRLKDYDENKATYLTSENSAEAVENYARMEESYDDLSATYKVRKVVFITAISLWSWNVIDAVILFPGKPKVKIEPVIKTEGNIKSSVSLTFNW